MKCLSVLQPWASLIILGAKKIETRSWPTKYRGPLLIHASKRYSPDLKALAETEPFKSAFEAEFKPGPVGELLPAGYILGSVELFDCVPVEEALALHSERIFSGRNERSFGDYTPGRFAWLLTNPTPMVSPIPYKGKLGIYNVSDKVLEGAAYV